MTQPNELVYQVERAQASIAHAAEAMEAASRATDDTTLSAALRQAASEARAIQRRLVNVRKWCAAA